MPQLILLGSFAWKCKSSTTILQNPGETILFQVCTTNADFAWGTGGHNPPAKDCNGTLLQEEHHTSHKLWPAFTLGFKAKHTRQLWEAVIGNAGLHLNML